MREDMQKVGKFFNDNMLFNMTEMKYCSEESLSPSPSLILFSLPLSLLIPSTIFPHLHWHKCAVWVKVLWYILEHRFVSNDVESVGLPVIKLLW
jgi:hypothetical protein